jgi:hypothetical protein
MRRADLLGSPLDAARSLLDALDDLATDHVDPVDMAAAVSTDLHPVVVECPFPPKRMGLQDVVTVAGQQDGQALGVGDSLASLTAGGPS